MPPTTCETTCETTFDESKRLLRPVTEGRNNIYYNIHLIGRARMSAMIDAGAAEEADCHADI